MPIDRQTIVHVSDLARIQLTDDEIDRFTDQLSVVLDAVARLAEVDTSVVAPSARMCPDRASPPSRPWPTRPRAAATASSSASRKCWKSGEVAPRHHHRSRRAAAPP